MAQHLREGCRPPACLPLARLHRNGSLEVGEHEIRVAAEVLGDDRALLPTAVVERVALQLPGQKVLGRLGIPSPVILDRGRQAATGEPAPGQRNLELALAGAVRVEGQNAESTVLGKGNPEGDQAGDREEQPAAGNPCQHRDASPLRTPCSRATSAPLGVRALPGNRSIRRSSRHSPDC